MLPIVTAPNSVLSDVAKPVGKIDSEIKKLIEDMKETLTATRDPEGVGLAAPQVGKSLQIFIVKENPKDTEEIYINPTLEYLGKETQHRKTRKAAKKDGQKLEGCLSLPRIWGPVQRASKVKVTYQDESGVKQTKVVGGFKAIIVQHEYDHLQGALFPRRVLEQKGKLYKSSKDEKGEDVFEEIEI